MPNFVVGGAARAGTTALIEGLRRHLDVFVTQPKEPHYFAYHDLPINFTGPGDEQWVNRVVVSDRSRYLALFDGADRYRARGDGSVSTLYLAERSAGELARINPAIRVVLVLREPVDRAYSSFAYLRLRGVETEADFRRALELEESRRAAGWHHMWHYAAMSRYAQGLRILQETLGQDQVRVWFYDDLQDDYERVLAEVVGFLGVPPFPGATPSLPRVNVSGTARSELAQRTVRWATRHQRVRAMLKHVVGFEARERIRRSVLRTDRPPTELFAHLEPLFENDLAQLAQLVPGDQPLWLSRHAPA